MSKKGRRLIREFEEMLRAHISEDDIHTEFLFTPSDGAKEYRWDGLGRAFEVRESQPGQPWGQWRALTKKERKRRFAPILDLTVDNPRDVAVHRGELFDELDDTCETCGAPTGSSRETRAQERHSRVIDDFDTGSG